MCTLLMIFKGLSKINENKITEQKKCSRGYLINGKFLYCDSDSNQRFTAEIIDMKNAEIYVGDLK